MADGVKHGLFFVAMSVITIAFCLLFYPPITEKLKKIIQLKEQKNYDNAKVYGDITEAVRNNFSQWFNGVTVCVVFFYSNPVSSFEIRSICIRRQ